MTKKKRKTKNKARRTTKKPNNKKAKSKFSVFRLITKWVFILSIWFSIAIFCMVLYLAHDLPNTNDVLDIPNKTGITILAYDDSVIGHYGGINGENIHINDLPQYIPEAFIAIEDRRFYQHMGIDPKGIARAMWQNLNAGKFVQGGSTITQQLAKNMFFKADKTIKRKVQEALLAIWLERNLTKNDILSAYLNRVYFGAGAYGIDSASRTYFNKSVYDINIPEAALLAGLLKAPSRYSPLSNPKLAIKRTKIVLNAMNDVGYLTSKEIKQLSAKTIDINISNKSTATSNKYFIDWVVNNISSFIGGIGRNLIVKTTFDPELQQLAVKNINKLQLKPETAFIAMTPDGAIRAMIGGKNYKNSHFNRATQALRQPGSAFKPFVYLTALTQGMRPSSMLLDAPITRGEYHPKNFANKYYGEVTMQKALSKSLNTATVRLTKEIGIGNVIKTAKKAGIYHDLRRDMSLALGSSEVSLLELTSTYAVFANGGYAVYPFGITQIKDSDDNILYEKDFPNTEQIFSAKAIRNLNVILSDVVNNGTGKLAKINNINIRGKTGTSQKSRDAWFIGYNDNMVAGVWIGYDDNKPMKGITGGNLPVQIWHDIMQDILPALEQSQHSNKTTNSGFSGFLRNLFLNNPN